MSGAGLPITIATTATATYSARTIFDAKADGGTTRSEADCATYPGAIWGNFIDDELITTNEVFLGETAITALGIGSAVSAANGSADDFVVGATGGSGAQYGMTILSDSSGYGHVYFGDDVDNDVGRIDYKHSGNNFEFYVNATKVWNISSSAIYPSGSRTLGTTSARISTVYAEDLNSNGDCIISGSAGTLGFFGSAGVTRQTIDATGIDTGADNGQILSDLLTAVDDLNLCNVNF